MSTDLRDLLATFEQLIEEHDDTPDDVSEGEDNFRCEGCIRCANCRFCTECEDCEDCTYCDACMECRGCTQARECVGCVGSSHSSHSGYCQGGSHLTLCYDCEDCVQCFACVGMNGAEFCILNQRYSRRDYFKKVSELRAELDALALEGWFPPWIDGATPAAVLPSRSPATEPARVVSPSPVRKVAAGSGSRLPEVGPMHTPPPVDTASLEAPPPFAADDADSTLSSLMAALDGLDIQTEPLDPDTLFDAMAPDEGLAEPPPSVAAPSFPPFEAAPAELSREASVASPVTGSVAPPRVSSKPPKPPPARPTAAEEEGPTQPYPVVPEPKPKLLTRGARPKRPDGRRSSRDR